MDDKRPTNKNTPPRRGNPGTGANKKPPVQKRRVEPGKSQVKRFPADRRGTTADKNRTVAKNPRKKQKKLKRSTSDKLARFINTIPLKSGKLRKSQGFRVASVVLAVLFGVYLISQVYRVYVVPVKTEVALEQTLYDNVTAEFFILRNEQLISSPKSGRTVPLVEDGERIAKNDTIALVFSDDSQASVYTKMRKLEEEINYYESLQKSAGKSDTDISVINKSLRQSYALFSEAADNNDISAINKLTDALKNQLTRRQMAMGQKVNYEQKLDSLKKEYNDLKSKKLNYSEIKAERSGYYVSRADGYENALDYSSADKLTPAQIENVFKNDYSAQSDIVGKIVDGYNWYMFCIVDNSVANKTAVGKKITLDIPFASVTDLEASVYKMQPSTEKNKTVVTLKCSQMSTELTLLRKEIGQIKFASYTGFKLSKDVIHEVDGSKGVYILHGNIITFKKINIIYTGDNFVIANDTYRDDKKVLHRHDPDYIKLYDKVIVKGEDLSDGKHI